MPEDLVDLKSIQIPSELRYKFWRDLDNICVFDVETTGLDWTDNDFRIVQFTAGIFNVEEDRQVSFINEYINPDLAIPPDSMAVHGLYHGDKNDASDIENHGKKDVSDCMKFKYASEKIATFMSKASLWCAFNHRFDVNAFASEMIRLDKRPLVKPTIDPLIFERKSKDGFKGTKLWDLAKDYGVATVSKVNQGEGTLHDAKTDVIMLKNILKNMAPKLPQTVEGLMKQQTGYYERQAKYAKERFGD